MGAGAKATPGTTWKPSKLELGLSPAQVGDTIRRIEDGIAVFNTATIENITVEHGEQVAHVVRPYIHTADFTYTGGVLTYIGLERYSIPVADIERWYEVLQRKALR